MGDIFIELKQHFSKGNALKRLMMVNVVVFVVLGLIQVIGDLFKIPGLNLAELFSLSSNPMELIFRPWTLLSYMFLHSGFMHILFNMLWLYWFGALFLQLFTEKQMVALYLFGGLAGAFLYLLAYNTIPFFVGQASSMVGASAAVIAIVCATAFRIPDHTVQLLFVGNVKLKYIALASILIDLLSITSSNAGGHIAHLGGAALGYFFVLGISKGFDMTKGLNRIIDFLMGLFSFKSKSKLKVKHKRPETDEQFRARRSQNSNELDQILDKLKKSGYDSLSTDEKRFLFDASRK